MVDFTVAICTYNGESRLSDVLDRLLDQQHTEHFSWEILIVDNNSQDRTAEVIAHYQSQESAEPAASSESEVQIRSCFEPQQGLAYARRRAIQEAQGALIGFLDDDNLPTPEWVAAAYNFGQSHPQAGAYGSQIHGQYESPPPKEIKKLAPFLAIVERGPHPLRYDTQKRWMFPAGAGLVVRRQVWIDHVPDRPSLKGVCANSLSSKGEDLETLTYIRKGGWEIWYNPNMRIYHHIPKSRFERHYLLNLFKGVGLSRYPVRMLRFQSWQRPFLMPIYLANDFRKLAIHFFKHRDRLNTNIVAACEMQLFLSSCLSPFYHWAALLEKEKSPSS